MAEGVDGLLHKATCPMGKPLPAETIKHVVEMTPAEPLVDRILWTCQEMAKAAGTRHRSVQWISAVHGLKPRRCQPSSYRTIRSLPPMYRKSPVSMSTQSMKVKFRRSIAPSGIADEARLLGTMAHDYKPHCAMTLFIALDVLEGRFIGQRMACHGLVGTAPAIHVARPRQTVRERSNDGAVKASSISGPLLTDSSMRPPTTQALHLED